MSKIIYIYSEFSEHCKETNKIIKNIDNINMLCIDNNTARTRVLSNQEFNITVVPTIILINDNIKIYEGDNAIDYIYQIYENIHQQQIIPTHEEKLEEKSFIETTPITDVFQEQEVEQTTPISEVFQEQEVEQTTPISDVFQEQEVEQTTPIKKEEEEESNLMSLVESMQKEREQLETAK